MTLARLTLASSVILAGCGQTAESPAAVAQDLVCPELAGNTDPLEISYSEKPVVDARIRAFVSAARGLNDVTLEIEKRAVDACRRIAKDLGAPEVPANATIDLQCAPLRTELERLAREGVVVRISIAPPRCEADNGRKARCETVSSVAATTEARTLCEAQAALYARCSLPSISFAGSKNAEDILRLGRSLEENLPSLLYAEMALARRLLDQVQAITVASARLAAEVKDAGPHGLACIGLAGRVTTKAADRLRGFVTVSAAAIAGLDPEIRPSPAGGAGEGATP